jgi:hypothetical protein
VGQQVEVVDGVMDGVPADLVAEVIPAVDRTDIMVVLAAEVGGGRQAAVDIEVGLVQQELLYNLMVQLLHGLVEILLEFGGRWHKCLYTE